MTTRRNFFIRSIVTLTGDITIGYAMASACVWIIQTAALGLFLSFLLWVLAIIVMLALSQYALHPAVSFALSDSKLDRGIDALSSFAHAAGDLAANVGLPAWIQLQQRMARFARTPAR